jgi:hypothetical protein
MEKSIPLTSTHLSRQQLNTYKELSNRLNEVHQLSKTDKYMKKIKTGKSEECFRQLGEIKRMEAEALKRLENYLKTDSQKNPSHNHNKDLKHLTETLKNHKKHGGWF